MVSEHEEVQNYHDWVTGWWFQVCLCNLYIDGMMDPYSSHGLMFSRGPTLSGQDKRGVPF